MAPERERLIFLFGEEALDHLDDYDLTVEADVMEAVERLLPSPRGSKVGDARAAIRTVAVRQILNDDPPEAWRAACRMRDAGIGREEVLGQLAIAVAGVLMEGLASTEPADPARLAAALDALPLPSAEQIAEVLVGIIRATPGLTADEHIERAVAALGPPATAEALQTLVERTLDHLVEGPLHWLANDVTVAYFDTVNGRTFTRRFSDAERQLGVLTVSVDLAGYQRFDTVRLADGTELDQFSADRGHLAWTGPAGWLDGFTDGDLLAVKAEFTAPNGDEPVDAMVSIRVLADAPAMTDELAATVRAAYDSEQHDHGLPVGAEDLVVWLCHHQPDMFTTPLPPLSDLIEYAGLALDGSSVAHDASVWRQERLVRRIHRLLDFVPEPHRRKVLGLAIEVLPDPDAEIDLVRTSLDECADDEMLEELADLLIPEFLQPGDEFLLDGVHAPGDDFQMVQRAIAVARRARQVATAEYLACVLRERCGQPTLALEHLTRAVEAQPRLGPVVERMGWYCFDRGDARGAMRWWLELDGPHPAASTLAGFLGQGNGTPKVGRNDPCWCGSGRKFKLCHQGANDLPALPDRVGWLCRKAALWIEHSVGEARSLLTDLAIAYVTGDPDADAADALDNNDKHTQMQFQAAFADPLLFDAALHEGGLFLRFLAERGDLLPDDERLLATAWLTVDRSVHEVLSVEHSVGLRLRNLATGDVVDVRERKASQQVQVGERYCARVAPDGATHQIIGGVFEVRTGHEQQVLDLCLDGDAAALCAWAGALARPPRIVHRPGMIDSMLDRDALQAAMDEDFADENAMLARLNAELSRQAQARWLDDHVPALDGLTPRQAAADPTRREQLERLLEEFDRNADQLRDAFSQVDGVLSGAINYDTAALRRELGLI